jgi:hypothetical protein
MTVSLCFSFKALIFACSRGICSESFLKTDSDSSGLLLDVDIARCDRIHQTKEKKREKKDDQKLSKKKFSYVLDYRERRGHNATHEKRHYKEKLINIKRNSTGKKEKTHF